MHADRIERNRLARTLGMLLLATGTMASPSRGQEAPESPRLPASATIPAGTYYEGQAIPLRVQVIAAGGDWPEIATPTLADAEIQPTGRGFQPLLSSGIGETVTETHAYSFDFRIVAKRPGRLLIPSIEVRQGEKTGRTRPLRLTVSPVPATPDRTSAFLGGVGPLEVEAEAMPTSVRVGQPFEFRLTLTGPGALGSDRPAELPGFDRLGLDLSVRPLPPERSENPPRRVFRYQIRPLKPGEVVLPPIAVSTFDPASRRFLTRWTHAVPIRIAQVATFDPSRLDYQTPLEPAVGWPSWVLPLVVGIVGLGLPVALIGWVRWTRSRGRVNAERLARSMADRFAEAREGLSPAVVAREVVETLAEYLWQVRRRPKGALTPDEARREFLALGASASLVEQAGTLVESCDRARFARPEDRTPEVDHARADALMDRTRALFRGLEGGGRGTSGGRKGNFKEPREAPGTVADA